MPLETTLLSIVWLIAAYVAAMAVGVTSARQWIAVVSVAVVLPVVVGHFWRAPKQAISGSHDSGR